MDGIHQALQAEAERRFQGQPASSAGIGAEVANSDSPSNPLAQYGMTNQSVSTGNQTMPTADNPSAGAISAVNKAAPNEASIIIKALIKRLHQNPTQ